uniref:DivIVA domain-containing protein n=1 Tax=Candidatus Fimenecus sp. TaxID=3022888 RepID=UPI00402528DC
MKFRKVFRGYDPRQVDEFLKTQSESDKMVLQATRERVDQLIDENKRLGEQLNKYRKDSEAISAALVQSQKLAKLLKNDAEKYSEVVLLRAKLFFAAWQAYAQTLVSTLSREELARFDEIKDKLEKLVYAYDGRNIAGETADLALSAD